ncbi:unnamed protein product [Arctia plantaginis]|nr:unnamed protein product [Arctia plantaginis]
MEVQNGHIKRLTDNEVNSIVLEIVSTNVATTYIVCPKNNQVLGIKLPFLVMIIKNLKRYFSFEITVLDDKNMRRRFRISNFQSTTKIKPFCTTMPIGLAHGWNQIQFNLADFTKRAYGTQFIETLRVQVHANARLRRIYFSERLYSEDELPQDYKLYLPLERKQKKGKVEKKEEQVAPAIPVPLAAPPTEGAAPPPAGAEPPPEGGATISAKSSKKIVAAASKAEVEKKSEGPEETAEQKEPEAPPSEVGTDVGTEGATEGDATPVEGEATPIEGEAPAEVTEDAPENAAESGNEGETPAEEPDTEAAAEGD